MHLSTLIPFILLALGTVSAASPFPQESVVKENDAVVPRGLLDSFWEGGSKGEGSGGNKPPTEAPSSPDTKKSPPSPAETFAAPLSFSDAIVNALPLVAVPEAPPFSLEMTAIPPPPKKSPLPMTDFVHATSVSPSEGMMTPKTGFVPVAPSSAPLLSSLPPSTDLPLSIATGSGSINTAPPPTSTTCFDDFSIETALINSESPVQTAPVNDGEDIESQGTRIPPAAIQGNPPALTQNNFPIATHENPPYTQSNYPIGAQNNPPSASQTNTFVTTQIPSSGSPFSTGMPQRPPHTQPGNDHESDESTSKDTDSSLTPSTNGSTTFETRIKTYELSATVKTGGQVQSTQIA